MLFGAVTGAMTSGIAAHSHLGCQERYPHSRLDGLNTFASTLLTPPVGLFYFWQSRDALLRRHLLGPRLVKPSAAASL